MAERIVEKQDNSWPTTREGLWEKVKPVVDKNRVVKPQKAVKYDGKK